MDDEEVVQLILDRETDRVERKASLAEPDRVCEAICAFANDLPNYKAVGVVAVGVDDNGRPTGLNIDDTLLLKLASLRDNGKILPFPTMHVRRVEIDGVGVAAVVVEPSSSPPIQFRGRTWIRVGPRRAIASREEEARLQERRHSASLPFDARPLVGSSISDLAVDRFTLELLPQLIAPDVLAANQRSVEHQMTSLRFLDPSSAATPTGILFDGIDPQQWLGGAYVQFLRVDGSTLASDVISEHRLTAPLPDLLRELEEVLRAHIDTAVEFVGSTREERRPSVPFEALQQIVRNALMHRSYDFTNAPVRVIWFDDRVEISSPGGPYGSVTIENFGQPGVVDYRNPTVAGVLAQLGYVQRFGVGLEVARELLNRNGNPPLELVVTATHVNATVRTRK